MARKKVALFVSSLYGDMVRQTTEGLIGVAKGQDVKLLFFTSFTDNYSSAQYDRYKDYDVGDFAVYLLPDLREYDALISYDTYMPIMYLDQMDRLKGTADCPVISLGAQKPGSRCSVVNDQARAMRELIEHVIVRHSCRDIVHVAGLKQMTFVQERIAIFRQTLEDHGLPCGDERIVYGDLTPNSGDAVVEEILARRSPGERRLPDAIVCANDYMAIGVIKALEDRGYRVPQDVLVTGYDDIARAEFNEPSLTTSAQPFAEVGQEGMRALLRLWQGETPEPVIAVPGILKCRQSCGCEPFNVYKRDTIREKYIATVTNLEKLALSNTNLILGAAMDETLDDIFDEIENGCQRETGFSDAVLCLIRDWDKKKVIESREDLKDETFDVVCGVYRGVPVPRGPLPKGALLPEAMMADDRPYYIFPVHHLQYFMGYFIVSPELKNLGQLHIKSWLVSISTVLVNWCIRRQLTETVKQLDHLYQTDMLTGLYNRRGYHNFFDGYYEECRQARTELAVFLIDMNHMKDINDTYGHAEGDYCLCAIADAMRQCAHGSEICVRTGGDEFVVLAKHYDTAKEAAFIRGFREALGDICARDGKPYRINAGVGCHRGVPPVDGAASPQDAAEEFLRRADQAMYRDKRERE